ncbi:MAG: DUF4397 domain-containing protein [Chloroflexota bacterium]|nr:DUF4397 domain-containing protein [Chloroflexota bacterium]
MLYPRPVVVFLRVMLVALVVSGSLLLAGFAPVRAQDDAQTRVRVVHGLEGVGPVDIYIDGALALIGLGFGTTSGELRVASGDHQLAVVPSGTTPDGALVAGPVTLRAGRELYATLVGTADAASVGLFLVDDRPLDAGRARFRIINGALDSNLVPAFAGGSALTEPLGFGDASEYSQIDAGVYDLDFLDEASRTPVVSLAGVEFAEGTANDILVVGQAVNGTLATIVESRPVEVTRPTGRGGQIVAGICDEAGDLVADLGLVLPGQGATVGVSTAEPTSQAYASAAVPFDALTSSPHSVIVRSEGGDVVACGEVGGNLTDTGSLVIALEGSGAAHGVAVLAPGLDAPDTTGISLFMVDFAAESTLPAAGTPVAAG